MTLLRKLAGQTAIYGLSSIVGRFLNYLLTPLYTSVWVFDPAEFGVITTFYAWAALFNVMLTYGMETAFFRFSAQNMPLARSSRGRNDRSDLANTQANAYPTAFFSLAATGALFLLLCLSFTTPIADFLGYADHPEYVLWFAGILVLDALCAIPLARLRQMGRPVRFAVVNLVYVAVNILLNVFFLAYCMRLHDLGQSNALIDAVYDPSIRVGYVFISGLIASAIRFLLLLPEWPRPAGFSKSTLRTMLKFASPLLIVGLAGMVNETADRIMLKKILEPMIGGEAANAEVGIYGACYKLSILITLFVQAFRYAAEPFFFAQAKDKNSGKLFARVMNVFVGATVAMFLLVMLFLDVFKYFIPNEAYWVGLRVVPILLMANVMLGIYYNQSIWYKLSDKTRIGGYIAMVGAVLTIALNWYWIPRIGYMGSAWATLIAYGSMVVISYFLGQKHHPIPYNVLRVVGYIIGGAALWYGSTLLPFDGALKYVVHAAILLAFILFVVKTERKDVEAITESGAV